MNPPPLRWLARLQIAFGLVALALVGLVGLLVAASPPAKGHAPEVLPALLAFAACVAVPAVFAGVALLRGNRWGPLATMVVGVLELSLLPIGTALGAVSLWSVWRATRTRDGRDVAADENVYAAARPRAEPPPLPPALEMLPDARRVAPLLLVIASVGGLFAVAITVGFVVSGDRPPAAAGAIAGPVLAVLGTVAVVAVRALRQLRGRGRPPA